jgi:hypothetical protein
LIHPLGPLVLLLASLLTIERQGDVHHAVLQRLDAEYPASPLVLYRDILRAECITGCREPWAGIIERDRLDTYLREGFVTQHCAYMQGLCLDDEGRQVRVPDAGYVMLTSLRFLSEREGLEVWATVVFSTGERSAIRHYWRFEFVRPDGQEWILTTVELRGFAYIDS